MKRKKKFQSRSFMLGCMIMCLLANCACFLIVFPDNEHTFLDMEEKLSKYFPKDWKQDLGKVGQPVSPFH